jgi:hypothetical protein
MQYRRAVAVDEANGAPSKTHSAPSFRFQLPFMYRASHRIGACAIIRLLRQSIAIALAEARREPAPIRRAPCPARLCGRSDRFADGR